jgi:hypothetical protein
LVPHSSGLVCATGLQIFFQHFSFKDNSAKAAILFVYSLLTVRLLFLNRRFLTSKFAGLLKKQSEKGSLELQFFTFYPL